MLQGWRWRRRPFEVTSTDADVGGGTAPRTISAAFRMPSLASATRDYARVVEAGTLDRLDARDLTRLQIAMGPEIWAWQYARRLTGQAPWRAAPAVDARIERLRAERGMSADIPTWERALVELDAETDRSRLYGKPAPVPLFVPPAIAAAIEARRAAALERIARRRSRASDGSTSFACAPDDAVSHSPKF